MVDPVALSADRTGQKADWGDQGVGHLAQFDRAYLFDAQAAGHKSMCKKKIAKMRKKNIVHDIG